MTQVELSEKTGVAQSLIAKIEAGKIIPSYTNAKKLFDFLFYQQDELTAKDLMSKKIISIAPNKTLFDAIELMDKKSVEQLPIIDSKNCVGSISEEKILNLLNESKNKEKILNTKLIKIMSKAFPLISTKTGIQRINSLLKENEAILVTEDNNIKGIITKTDLLKKITRK